MAGRGTTRTKDATADILERISQGESLRRACEANNLKHSAFLDLCAKDKEVADQYAYAREVCLKLHADEIIEIADNASPDHNRDRLRIDARKWLLSKLLPKQYGDKLDLNHAGKDGGPLEFLVKVDRDPGT